METHEFLVALDRDSAAFVDACEVAGLTASVQSCPGWSVADLLWHVYDVHDFWNAIVSERRTDLEGLKPRPRPPDEDLAPTYRQGRADLLETMSAVDPKLPV